MVSVEVEVGVPADVAFAAITDWPGQSRWVAMTRVAVVAGDGRTPGSVVEAFTGWKRVGFLDTMVVTSWDEPEQVDVVHIGRVVRGPGRMRVEKLSQARALIVWQEWLHLPLGRLGLLAWAVVRPLAAAALRRSLRVLCRRLEAQR